MRQALLACRAKTIRQIDQFAEEEIILPDGPFEGRKFRVERQPYARLLFGELKTGRWARHFITGPTQSGKTLSAFIIPILYHLFELGESVICGVPKMDMAADKWTVDILPAIQNSRYRDLLPELGNGSKGGRADLISFRNGARLKFMAGGGSDKARAGFTSRVVVITETDGMDEAGQKSREADKITQLEARTRAFGARRRIYAECTVSIESGRTWSEYTTGTRSRIALHCPACSAWVTPERDSLVGWQEAKTVDEARQNSAFGCPACGVLWSETERRVANVEAKLLHDGQTISAAGDIEGPIPATDTLGFRWSAVNNLFLTAGDIGVDEWRAARAADEENAEKAMRQFVWALPHQPQRVDLATLDALSLAERCANSPRGNVPTGTECVTVGLDLGKYTAHYSAIAWRLAEGLNTGTVIDYGVLEVPSRDLGIQRALLTTLHEFRDLCATGWPGIEGQVRPLQAWVDGGYELPIVAEWHAEPETDRARYRVVLGRGVGQQRTQAYGQPKTTGATIRHIGTEYHITWQPDRQMEIVEINADYWKTQLHDSLSIARDQPGAMLLYRTEGLGAHLTWAKHVTAEKQIEQFIPGAGSNKGQIRRWEKIRAANHYLDATVYALAAAQFVFEKRGVAQHPQPAIDQRRLTTPDGRPFLVTERA